MVMQMCVCGYNSFFVVPIRRPAQRVTCTAREFQNSKHCGAYEEERKANSVLQQPYQEDEEEIIGQLLFNKENLEKSKILLETFWRKRTKKMKELE